MAPTARTWPEGALAGAIAALPATWIMARLNTEEDDAEAGWLARAAEVIFTGHALNNGDVDFAIPIVRYSLGTALGAAYGSLAEMVAPNLVAGGLWGSAAWLLEVLTVPEAPATVRGLAAHVVFGVMLEMTRRTIRPLV